MSIVKDLVKALEAIDDATCLNLDASLYNHGRSLILKSSFLHDNNIRNIFVTVSLDEINSAGEEIDKEIISRIKYEMKLP
ncbi:MAG TPA: hypothetical protein VKA13_06970 [Gammaproteobacteria bacterium]|nr:hypothetical protein [Gammaproteobacteria bacterium]